MAVAAPERLYFTNSDEANELLEEVELGPRQRHVGAVPGHGAAGDIDDEAAKPKLLCFVVGGPARRRNVAAARERRGSRVQTQR
jgi:hypothetical protein